LGLVCKLGVFDVVVEVAKKIAELKELNEDVVRQQLLTNSRNFFGI
jgi:Tat protein secretion system quality control protein TatD with DNase activity